MVLPQRDLEELSKGFWSRYKVSWPAFIEPVDLVTCRAAKQIARRMLVLEDLLKVKTLALERVASRRQQTVAGTDLTIVGDAQKDNPLNPTVENY